MWCVVCGYGDKGFSGERPTKLKKEGEEWYLEDFDITFPDVGFYELCGSSVKDFVGPFSVDNLYFYVSPTKNYCKSFLLGLYVGINGEKLWSQQIAALN